MYIYNSPVDGVRRTLGQYLAAADTSGVEHTVHRCSVMRALNGLGTNEGGRTAGDLVHVFRGNFLGRRSPEALEAAYDRAQSAVGELLGRLETSEEYGASRALRRELVGPLAAMHEDAMETLDMKRTARIDSAHRA